MLEELEDEILLIEAENRLLRNSESISLETVLQHLGISEDELMMYDDIEIT